MVSTCLNILPLSDAFDYMSFSDQHSIESLSTERGSLTICEQSLKLTYLAGKPAVCHNGKFSVSIIDLLKSILIKEEHRQHLISNHTDLDNVALLVNHLANKDLENFKIVPLSAKINKISNLTSTDWFKSHSLNFQVKKVTLTYDVTLASFDNAKVDYNLKY